MSQLIANCPRCNAQRMRFDVLRSVVIETYHNWQSHWEAFCFCGSCSKTTIFCLKQLESVYTGVLHAPNDLSGVNGVLNNYVAIKGFISAKDKAATPPPEHLPAIVLSAFNEGARCMTVSCMNAAGTMFRLCIDLATRTMLPEGTDNGLNYRTRRDLGLRLPWLFDNGVLPEALRELSTCIKEDGNDGAHQGTLTEEDAQDLLDFTEALLTRIYTEPERLRLAKERREQRRAG